MEMTPAFEALVKIVFGILEPGKIFFAFSVLNVIENKSSAARVGFVVR